MDSNCLSLSNIYNVRFSMFFMLICCLCSHTTAHFTNSFSKKKKTLPFDSSDYSLSKTVKHNMTVTSRGDMLPLVAPKQHTNTVDTVSPPVKHRKRIHIAISKLRTNIVLKHCTSNHVVSLHTVSHLERVFLSI